MSDTRPRLRPQRRTATEDDVPEYSRAPRSGVQGQGGPGVAVGRDSMWRGGRDFGPEDGTIRRGIDMWDSSTWPEMPGPRTVRRLKTGGKVAAPKVRAPKVKAPSVRAPKVRAKKAK